MPATARNLEITGEELDSAGSGGSAYAALEVPGDYEAILVDVDDYDKRDNGGSFGWIFKYKVEGLDFQVYLAFSKAARWKLIEVLEAHGVDLSEGINSVDPNVLIQDVVGAHIDFPKSYYAERERVASQGGDPDTVKGYREIRWLFPLEGTEEPPVSVPGPQGLAAEEPEAL